MSGFVYLIRNGGLHKIGHTKNINQRMKQLKPHKIIAVLKTNHYRTIEKELHKAYRSVRLPQSEYFRLKPSEVKEIKRVLSGRKGFQQKVKEWLRIPVLFLLFIIFLLLL